VGSAVAEGDGGHARHSEPAKLLIGGGILIDVDGIELDPPRREQLLRLGAGRSAGAIEQAGTCHVGSSGVSARESSAPDSERA